VSKPWIMPKPFRVMCIIFCALALAAPAIVCFGGASARAMLVMDVIRTLFPVWFLLLTQACIDEGRERERKRWERRSE
jgi:hypothetical protein